MFLSLTHTKLDIYAVCRLYVKECYRVSTLLPPEEKFNMVQQMRRAALSVLLNVAEGSSRKSDIERKRYFEISRGLVIEIDTILDIGTDLNYWKAENLAQLGEYSLRIFKMLSVMISKNSKN